MRRPRGPGGRFLTAAEIAAMKQAEANGESAEGTTESGDMSPSNKKKGGADADLLGK